MTGQSVLRWTPRILGVLYAVFISLFALDVWGTGAGFWEELAGFLVHLMPTYFIAAALVVAWKNPRLGGVLFILMAMAFGIFFFNGGVETLLLVALAPTAIGLLFLCDACVEKPGWQFRT